MFTSLDVRALYIAAWLLRDAERRDALRQEGERLQEALYVNLAMHNPQALTSTMRKYDTRITTPRFPRAAIPAALEDARAVLRAQESAWRDRRAPA